MRGSFAASIAPSKYAEYTEEERPVSIQIFGGDPERMAEAARVVEGMGADIVDVNMGCPVPKIAKHNAGCSLMQEPAHAATVIASMVKAVRIPVTVKMRKGWDERALNAADVARRVQDAGASAIAIHGRTAKQSYTGTADWDIVASIADSLSIPVFGSGDCIEPQQIVDRLRLGVSGVFVGRGVLRNPSILAQAQDIPRRPAAATDFHGGPRPIPARLHRLAPERADRRRRGLPSRRPISRCAGDDGSGASPHDRCGDQRAAGTVHVVIRKASTRCSHSHRGQCGDEPR